MNDYENAKACYWRFGVEVERALARLAEKAISIHCWQGDDVAGFDQKDGKAGDGIQTTGNYPGKARNFEELKADFLKAAGLIPGKKRINLACELCRVPGRGVGGPRQAGIQILCSVGGFCERKQLGDRF